MNVNTNLEQDLMKWKEQYAKYSSLFSTKVLKSKGFKRERLKQLLAIEAKYNSKVVDPSIMTFLRIEKRELQKEVSRNVLTYWLRRAFNKVQVYFKQREFRKQEEIGLFETNVSLEKLGMKQNGNKIENFLSSNQSQGTYIQTDQLAPNQQVEYKLNFDRQKLDGHTVTFIDRQNNITRAHRAGPEIQMPMETTAKLLAGRAIKENGQWVQMDFNDKTPDGNYRIVRCTQDQLDSAIINAIQGLPLKESFTANELQKKMEDLGKGNPTTVTLVGSKGEVVADVFANPRNVGVITVYAKDGKIIDPQDLRAKETNTQENTQSKQQAKINRSSLKVSM